MADVEEQAGEPGQELPVPSEAPQDELRKKKKKKKKKKKAADGGDGADGADGEASAAAPSEGDAASEAVPPAAEVEEGFEDLSGDGGLQKRQLQAGAGECPPKGWFVEAHYTGTLEDGSTFDSSRQRDKVFVFQLGAGKVIKAWDETFKGMRVGERAVIRARSDYAYGAEGYPPAIPGGATLTFDVELLGFYQYQCSTPGCGKKAAQQCPKCSSLKLAPAFFCSQDCFKRFYPVHKRVHRAAEARAAACRDDAMPPEFRRFTGWTGDLRPWARSKRRTVPDEIVKPDYAQTGTPQAPARRGAPRVTTEPML